MIGYKGECLQQVEGGESLQPHLWLVHVEEIQCIHERECIVV